MNTKPTEGKTDAQTNSKGLIEGRILPSSMSWSSVRNRMILGRMLRTWRSLWRRDLGRYPDRYPEPWDTGRIPTRTSRRSRGRGAKSPHPAITAICSHDLSPLSHTQESAASTQPKSHTQMQNMMKIADASLAKPLLCALPSKCTRLG